MRITVRISSFGKYWYPQWPRIPLEGCYPKINGVETFDESVFRRQAAQCPQILIGSHDYGAPLAFGAMLIQSVNDWMDINDRDKDEKSGRIDARINRRMSADIVSFCRVDITAATVTHNGQSIRVPKVRIETKDNNIVQMNSYEIDFAMLVADFCRCYSDRFVREGNHPIVFTAETLELLRRLHERTIEDERQAGNEKRIECERFRNGYCTPCKFDCPHYKNGKCVEV